MVNENSAGEGPSYIMLCRCQVKSAALWLYLIINHMVSMNTWLETAVPMVHMAGNSGAYVSAERTSFFAKRGDREISYIS